MNGAWPLESLDIWMHNASADLRWHEASQTPFTLAHRQRQPFASYLTSLRSGWFDYAAQELKGSLLAACSVRVAGQLVRFMGLDQLVLVGNWPVSTNLWQAEPTPRMMPACQDLAARYPRAFVGVRNLQAERHAALINELRGQGFCALPARVVYEFDLRHGPTVKPSHLMRDRAALKRSGLQVSVVSNLTGAQAARLRDLYQAIYIDKHSALNAQYTAQFFADMLSAQVMQALLLKNQAGEVVAFAMLYQVGDTLSVPALGYDANAQGLYRMLFAAIFNFTQEQRLLLNYSSGAGDFKRKRGGQPQMEYTLLRAPQQSGAFKARLLSWLESRAGRLQVQDLIALGA